MNINKLVNLVNAKLAGETLSYNEMLPFLDEVIDEINAELGSKYPVFSELESPIEYNYFPDRFIRTVVAVGTAWYWYNTDEEGEEVAPVLRQLYFANLFKMVRDWIMQVPNEYLEDFSNYQGSIPDPVEGYVPREEQEADELNNIEAIEHADPQPEKAVRIDGSTWRV